MNVNKTLSYDILTHIATESRLSATEVRRIFLTLQHNGFSSGLYEFLSIANHSCNPNCIKFVPQTTTAEQLTRTNQGSGRHTTASEIWSTRPILKDEEITICYCVPLEMTNSAMHTFLMQHHRFVCQCNKCLNSSRTSSNTSSAVITSNDTVIDTTTSNLLTLFSDITSLNTEYYRVSVPFDVSAETALTSYLSREGLRMLSGMPPGHVVETNGAESGSNIVEENNTATADDDEQLEVDLKSVTVTDVEDSTAHKTTNTTKPLAPAVKLLDYNSELHLEMTTLPSSDPVSLFVENELAGMEAELMWYRTEDSANNLKTYSSMAVACEYLLSYYGANYKNASTDPSSNLHSCIAQISARILKVSLQAVLICVEMFEDIRSQATSQNSRSHSVAARLKCKKYIENIVIDKLLFQFVIEVYVKNALLLSRFQRFYLGDEHSDISTTCYDIVQGIELLYKQEGDKVKALYSTIKRFPDSVLGGGKQGGDKGSGGVVNRTPGTVYWGTKQALDKLSSN
eukprot:gene31790-39272_t